MSHFLIGLIGLFILLLIFILSVGGIVLGETKEGIQSFSNLFWNNETNYIHINNKLYNTGLKWECVEFVRRYLILVKGVTFESIDNALQLTKINNFVNIDTLFPIPINHNQNGQCFIEKDDILVIKNSSPFGHVAIVSNVDKDTNTIEIVEQNYNNYWFWSSNNYSRCFVLRDGMIFSNDQNETIIDIIKF